MIDIYCALCGGGLHGLPLEKHEHASYCVSNGGKQTEDEETGDEYCDDCGYCASSNIDTNIINDTNVMWLTQLRVVGCAWKYPAGTTNKTYYLTGLGRAEDMDTCLVDKGTDPKVPPQAYFDRGYTSQRLRDPSRDQERRLRAYWSADFPIHDSCLQVFHQALRISKGTSVGHDIENPDLELIVRVMKSKNNQNSICLGLDYGEFKHTQGEGWEVEHGFEPYLFDPFCIPKLKELPLRLAGNLTSVEQQQQSQVSTGTEFDSWSRLPAEMLDIILKYLEFEDLIALRSASRVVEYYTNASRLGRSLMKRDMPYLWEINEEQVYPNSIDWFKVYKEVRALSYLGNWNKYRYREYLDGTLLISDGKYFNKKTDSWAALDNDEIQDYSSIDAETMAIASRRRVWNCCQQILNLYPEVVKLDAEMEYLRSKHFG